MRYSGIGGQAVMEGVMMKNQEKYAVAVRKPDQEIVVETSTYEGLIKNKKIRNMPILRGVFSFIESLVLGIDVYKRQAPQSGRSWKKSICRGENTTRMISSTVAVSGTTNCISISIRSTTSIIR